MTQKLPLSRPAMSAIAAFLALSTPAAFAQEAPIVPMTPPVASPPVASPPTVAQPSTTAPVAAPQTAQPPAPKPVIRVPLDLPAVPAEPAPKATERAAAPAPQRSERAAPRPRAVERTAAAAPAAAPEPATPVAETAPLASEAAPIVAPVMAPAEPVAEAAPQPAEAATTGDSFPWELAGGAAALLIVGGAGLAFARRRRSTAAEVADEGMDYEAMKAAEAVPYSPPREEIATAPQPAPRSTPSFAAAPSGSMGRHEAMALAGPTEDNPFATLKKRLARARFLDSQERAEYDETLAAQKDMSRKPVSAWEIAQRPAPAATQQQDVRRPESARGRTSFRPGYSNN